jgi:predicted PurR-regulated permease PerM
VLQQLEGHIVAPQIFGHTLRVNPLLVIFALLIGLQLYGVIGALVALPIAAVLRETAVYLRRHLVLEPWERSPGKLL